MFQGCVDDFRCANQGQSPLVNSVDDARELYKTRRALSLLGERVKEPVRLYLRLELSKADHH